MKTLTLLLAATAILSAESTIGISTPPGSDPLFTKDLPALRHFARLDKTPAHFTAAAKENGTKIFAVIRAEEDFSKIFATTYGKSLTHWEVLPPADLDPNQANTPYEYVQRLSLARKAARETAPAARTGISISHYDLQFLDSCLRDGAVGQFDFVSLSPFPVSPGTDRILPGALATVRKLLAHHGLPAGTPIHITLTGAEAHLILAAASARTAGFDHVFIAADAKLLAKIPEKRPADLSKSHAESTSVSLTLGKTNESNGLEQILAHDTPWDAELKANRLHLNATPPVFRTTFLADPTFLNPERKSYEITVEAKRLPSEDGLQNPTGLVLTYEATHGLRTASFWSIPGDNKWQTHTWKITDAHFSAKLGWHFLLDASGSGNDVLLREVKVSK